MRTWKTQNRLLGHVGPLWATFRPGGTCGASVEDEVLPYNAPASPSSICMAESRSLIQVHHQGWAFGPIISLKRKTLRVSCCGKDLWTTAAVLTPPCTCVREPLHRLHPHHPLSAITWPLTPLKWSRGRYWLMFLQKLPPSGLSFIRSLVALSTHLFLFLLYFVEIFGGGKYCHFASYLLLD